MSPNGKNTNAIFNHLKQWQELGVNFQQLIEPAHMQQSEYIKSIKPILDSQKALQKSLEPLIATLENQLRNYPLFEHAQNSLHYFGLMAEQSLIFSRSLEGVISPAFDDIRRSFEELPPKTQKALLHLGEYVWYFDLDMPFSSLWELEKALEEGNVQEVEKALIKYFEDRLDLIEESIVGKFPFRKKIITAAFSAHRRGEFELSIPVLLSQTDGICKEVVNEYFFIKKNKKPRTATYVDQIAADTYRAAILTPLAQNLPIVMSEQERGPDFNELNRHTVLHGDSIDYGTKINSFKTISLINYVTQVLRSNDSESP